MIDNIEWDSTIFLVIAAAAIVTYAFRIGGLMLADMLPDSVRFRRFMEALPGTILLSLVVPGIIAAGFWGYIAVAAVAVCTYKTKNLFLSMMIGVVIVAVQRQLSV